MNNKMVLGTVQLGLNYGINNKIGKPTKDLALKILDYAYNNGIGCLDTASAYGDSEQIIGEYIKYTGNKFNICTKLPINLTASDIEKYYLRSIEKLNIEQIYVLYLHRFEQCKEKDIFERLLELKQYQKIKYIGISIYEPEELKYIINNFKGIIDIIQIPINLFDNYRWIQNGLLQKAKDNGFILYARSVYLQGLFFLNPLSDRAKKLNITNSLRDIKKISELCKCQLQELAIAYITSLKEIDCYLVGCETLEQLRVNIQIGYSSLEINVMTQMEITNISKKIKHNVIDPREWSD